MTHDFRRLLAGLLGIALIASGVAACPRDPRPERTPCAAPSGERCLQTGRQPTPDSVPDAQPTR